MKILALLLLLPCISWGAYRPRVITDVTPQAVMNNFEQAALQTNRKLDKFGNETVYGNPTFSGNVTISGDATLSGDNTISGDTVFSTTSTFTQGLVITCPTGFTSIETLGRQLGCAQTDEAAGGSVTWEEAAAYCWGNYGGTLIPQEAFQVICSSFSGTMDNLTDDWEWAASSSYESETYRASVFDCDASPYFGVNTWDTDTAFRCWIGK